MCSVWMNLAVLPSHVEGTLVHIRRVVLTRGSGRSLNGPSTCNGDKTWVGGRKMTQSTERWPNNSGVLHLAHRVDRCSVLGPGVRAVLWLQGCRLRCEGCIAPQSLAFGGGAVVEVETVARELSQLSIDGVTLSGGEPFEQASALCRLIDLTRAANDLSFLSYTGYVLEDLREHGTRPQRELLHRLDILIDGPYIQGQHGDQLWRGSRNQRIHFLSDRHTESVLEASTSSTALEFTISADGSLFWMGIPPPGFGSALLGGLAEFGITFAKRGGYHE